MRSKLFTLCVAAALLGALPALAQPDPATAEAEQRYKEGIALHDRGREQDAYVKFAQAYAVLKTPPILFNLARTEQLTMRLVEANAHFREYLALPDQRLIPKESRDKARAYAAELRGQLGHLAITAPAGASISIDGAELGARAPIAEEIDVMPGHHVIVARLDDSSTTATLSVAGGVTTRVGLQFEQRPAAQPSPSPATLPSAQATSVPPPSPERPTVEGSYATRDVVRWTSTGVAIAGVAVGVGFMLAANSKDDDLKSYQLTHAHACVTGSTEVCAAASSFQNDRDRARTFSTIGFVIGGLGVATAAASWLFWPRNAEGTRRGGWVAPSFGVTGYGLQAGGRF